MKIEKALSEAYHDATEEPFGYLLIDLRQDTPRNMMVRTRLTPEETIKGVFAPVIYVLE